MEMIRRTDLQDHVTQQLQTVITDTLSKLFNSEDVDSSLIYNNLVKCGFVSVIPPLEEPPKMQLLTMDSLRNYKEGSSIKPGNIMLNIRKLVEAIPEVISIGSAMACDNLVFTISGAFSLWLKLKDIATFSISKEQAFVIVALWKKCNDNHKITLDDGFIATNNLLEQYGEPVITSIKYNKIIDSLAKVKCIEIIEDTIWLREWISQKYIYSI